MQGKLVVENLDFQFVAHGRVSPILVDVGFSVEPGQFVSIVGPSGCGKTTLLRILCGLQTNHTGSITIDGRPVRLGDRNKSVVFQQDSLMPWRKINANIAFGLEVQGVERSKRNAIATELAEVVGLAGYESHYPHELSGGMRQRVNVARALAIDPTILLMDEPFSALDAQTREGMQEELLRIWEQGRKSVVFVTHQIDEACFLSDRVIVLSAGPGRVKADIEIPMGRPRRLEMKRESSFQDLVREVWSHIDTSSYRKEA